MYKIVLFLCFSRLFAWDFSLEADKSCSKWMEDQIREQLESFQCGIDRVKIKESFDAITESFWGSHAPIAYVRFCQGQCLFEVPSEIDSSFIPRIQSFKHALEQIHDQLPLPDFELLVSLDDCSDRPLYMHQTRVPIFSVSKRKKNQKVLLMPPGIFHPDREKQCEHLYQMSKQQPWADRSSVVFWQLGTFNREDIEFDWRHGQTLPLLYLSKQQPDLLDFSIPQTSLELLNWRAKHIVKNSHFIKADVPLEERFGYRYQLIFDQRAVPRDLESQMLMGSVLFIADSDSCTWFSPLLIRGKHFVVLDERCQNLLKKHQWCEEHRLECEQIIESARALRQTVLCDQQVFSYFNALIRKYINLIN